MPGTMAGRTQAGAGTNPSEQPMSITDRVIAAKERKAGQETRKAFLEDPIVTDQLHGALLGIVRQVITRGEDSLSPNQRSVCGLAASARRRSRISCEPMSTHWTSTVESVASKPNS